MRERSDLEAPSAKEERFSPSSQGLSRSPPNPRNCHGKWGLHAWDMDPLGPNVATRCEDLKGRPQFSQGGSRTPRHELEALRSRAFCSGGVPDRLGASDFLLGLYQVGGCQAHAPFEGTLHETNSFGTALYVSGTKHGREGSSLPPSNTSQHRHSQDRSGDERGRAGGLRIALGLTKPLDSVLVLSFKVRHITCPMWFPGYAS